MGVAIVLILVVAGRKVAATIAPAWEWWQGRTERRFQRQVRIEAAAKILNDKRVVMLLERVDGLSAEIRAQRDALLAQRDEERARADHLEKELVIVRSRLDDALSEIRGLKRSSGGQR
ncbi:hypothetical protein F8M49_00040 [Rhodococcus zopfii]|uniref:Uncharacterized protein n=1 Tax=Rhodococcus zopfii TaxID=43772 RepID=A0ABU3WJM2_9NOCA|nr:hypothetical protein [Rhodococcus zopfii]